VHARRAPPEYHSEFLKHASFKVAFCAKGVSSPVSIQEKELTTAALPATSDPARSKQSLAFEELWRSLPKDGAIPNRRDFNPAQAVPFLSQLVLMDVEWGTKPILRIRLAGTGFESRVQNKLDGQNYLDVLPAEYHAGAIESTRLMHKQPCGLWQITKLHYQRLFAEPVEYTSFPLTADGDRPALIVTYVVPLRAVTAPNPTGGKPLLAETATHWTYIDIGYGIPPRTAA
jgi:hypothetical protein